MNSSSSITKLAEALKVAQAEMKNPHFDAKNPHFGSSYASLVSVREAVIPVLNKHGLSVTQFPKCHPERAYAGCVSRLMHSSGEWIEEECLLPMGKETAHGAGSAITYARRYSLQSIAGVVADEDDDGNAASNSNPKHKSVPQDEWDKLSVDEQTWLLDIAQNVKNEISVRGGAAGLKVLEEQNLSVEHKTAIWSRFSSGERSAMKKKAA